MADLYINGLFWKSMAINHNREYIIMEIMTSLPKYGSIEDLDPIEMETIRFIKNEIKNEDGSCKEIYNLDDPNIYVDILTNGLRTRKIEDYSEFYLSQEKRRAKVERPVESRFDILDI